MAGGRLKGLWQRAHKIDMLPLARVRVIAVEQYRRQYLGSMLLGDLGAEVIKIGEFRSMAAMSHVALARIFSVRATATFFRLFNRNKRSLTLNLKAPEARRVFGTWSAPQTPRSTICAAISRNWA